MIIENIGSYGTNRQTSFCIAAKQTDVFLRILPILCVGTIMLFDHEIVLNYKPRQLPHHLQQTKS